MADEPEKAPAEVVEAPSARAPGRTVAITIALIVLTLVVIAGFAYVSLWTSPPPALTEPVIVSIERGQTTRHVARLLKRAGVIKSSILFSLYAKSSGGATRIKPGDYAFKGGERIPDVLSHLVRGDFITVNITIPEGLTLHEIAMRVGESGLACPAKFERDARRGALVRALGLMPLGAEGYLFPATYKFSPHAKSDDVLAAMLARFYAILTPKMEERMFELGLDARRLVTIASMVEREAKSPAERPLIASVFYNRMKYGMPLQSDPTAEYTLDGVTDSAHDAVRTPSAFNTYLIAGLPPGPIANPGMKSIEAALYPARTDFLYFVARDGGTHEFSKSFNQHRVAVARLRRIAGRAAAGARGASPR